MDDGDGGDLLGVGVLSGQWGADLEVGRWGVVGAVAGDEWVVGFQIGNEGSEGVGWMDVAVRGWVWGFWGSHWERGMLGYGQTTFHLGLPL